MKTQISRWSEAGAQRRSGLHQQQDRMLIDSDLNELMELLKQRVDDALGDVIGGGAPRSAGAGLIESGPQVKRAPIYIDGIRARLQGVSAEANAFALTEQADFPSPPAHPDGDYLLYADVWEWPTTALQDPSILDPALHGADTATRTQTLAQVKWCPVATDPLTDPKNPAKGDALLALAIRAVSNVTDACDPCAAEIAAPSRIGNYLFRVEVHDVQGAADAPTEITLKWSSENAAEQHAQATVPEEFTRGDWIYEFYSDTTEKHLGIHLAPAFSPARSILTAGWPAAAISLPNVRRWDGYAVLERSGSAWSIKTVGDVPQARDKGRALEHIYTAPDFIAQLSGLSLRLTLAGKRFVAGDFWLATVREDAEPDSRVRLASGTPLGITHHYMVLARANGASVQALNDPDTRRLSFPRLANLTADRLGYDTTKQTARWNDVLDDASLTASMSTQSAIDLLLERFESSDLRYQIPGCGTDANATVRSLLGLVAGSPEKTDSVLTQLLCNLKATGLPVDKSTAGLHPMFNVPSISSVQQALSLLATLLAGPACESTVGPGGRYATLADAFTALASADDISLCLLPGVQSLPNGATLTGKRTIRLTGTGAYASKVNLGNRLLLSAKEVILRDLSMVGQGVGHLLVQADRVVTQNSGFARAASWNSHIWSKRFGGGGADVGFSTAIDSSGNIVLVGSFSGNIIVEGTNLNTAGGTDILVVKLDLDGKVLWAKKFGSSSDDIGMQVAIDSNNDIVLSGSFRGTVSFEGINLQSAGERDLFVAKLNPGGVRIWAKRFGGSVDNDAVAMAVDADKNVLLTGFFRGTFDFEGAALPNNAGGEDAFFIKLSADGNPVFKKTLGGASNDQSVAIAVDKLGNILLTGTAEGPINLGGGVWNASGLDIWVAKFSPAGDHLWSKLFAGAGANRSTAIAVDANNNVILAGSSTGSLNFGGGDFQISRDNLFVVSLSSGGNLVWARCFPSDSSSSIDSMAIDAGGNILFTGSCVGGLNFGDALESVNEEADIFVAKLDFLGQHVWSRRFGGSVADQGLDILVDASGNAVLTGYIGDTVNFGGPDLISSGPADIFVAKLTPEPVLNPLVTIRPRDPARGTDLIWSENDMLVTLTDGTASPQLRTALALGASSIGGSIVNNTIKGRLLLLSDSPLNVSQPLPKPNGVNRVGGGAYLTIRGNHVGRVSSRAAIVEPRYDAFGSLIFTGNTITESSNSWIADGITLSKNHFLTPSLNEPIGTAVARCMTLVANTGRSERTPLRVAVSNVVSEANNLVLDSLSNPVFSLNPSSTPWHFGGVGADLL
jgi:hypothetical protein